MNTAWIVGDTGAAGAGTILKTVNGGGAWGAQVSNAKANLTSVWGANNQSLWAVGAAGTIVNTANGGTAWAVQVVPAGTPALNGVWGSSGSDIFAVGLVTTVHYDGTSWTASPNGLSINAQNTLFGVTASDATHHWTVGNNGDILFHN
jgi:photosystem II stability/assembly factor-like uncharacterized protein